MKKIFAIAATVALITTLLVGCGKDDDDKVVFNHFQTSECKTLDANLATDAVSGNVMYNATERLVKVTAEGELVPAVAKSWEVSEDGKTLTFELRDDSMWVDHTGKEVRAVTAQDFVSTIEFMGSTDENGDYNSQNASYVTKYIQVDEAKAIDDTTLEIKLLKPEDYSVTIFSHYAFAPRPADFIEDLGGDDKYGLGKDSTLYNGPYYIGDYKATSNIKLTKNEKYWNADEVTVDEVNLRVYVNPDYQTLASEYESGNLSAVQLMTETITEYGDEDDVKLYNEMVAFNFVINLAEDRNTDIKYFAENIEGRKALSMAYDANYISNDILKSGHASSYWVPKGLDVDEETGNDFRTDSGHEDGYYSYDVAEAQKYWEEFKKKTGKDSFEIEILNYDSESTKKIVEYLQQELEKNLEGLTIKIKPVAFQDKLNLGKNGDFDINFYGWSPDYPNAKGMLTNYESDSPYNEIKYSNAKYDELLKDGSRKSLIEAEQILFDDAVMFAGYQRVRVYRVSDKFKNFELLTFGGDWDYSAIELN